MEVFAEGLTAWHRTAVEFGGEPEDISTVLSGAWVPVRQTPFGFLDAQLRRASTGQSQPKRGSKPEPPKIPSADQRGLSRARSMG